MRAPDFAAEPWRSLALDLLRHLDVPGGRSHADLAEWRRARAIKAPDFVQLLAHLDCEGWARTAGHAGPRGADGRAVECYSRAPLVRWYAVRREVAGARRRIPGSGGAEFGLY